MSAPRSGEQRLVRRLTRGGHARRAQDQLGERVVGDQVGDRPRRLQLADVLDLRLGERPRSTVGRVRLGHCRRRERPRDRRSCGSGRRRHRRRSSSCRHVHAAHELTHRAAVLALHLVVERRERPDGAAVLRLPRDVEAVRVDDGHAMIRRALSSRASDAVPVAQDVVGELDRVLRRRPLARVVHAHVEEDRLAVVGVGHVVGDLQADDVAAEPGRMRERDQLRPVRVGGGEPLHLELVVREPPVRVRAGREVRLRVLLLVLQVRRALRLGLRFEVGDLDLVPEAGVAQRPCIARAVQHDIDGVAVTVLRQVQLQRLERPLGHGGPGLDGNQLLLLGAALGHGREADRHVRARRPRRDSGTPGRRSSGRSARSPRPARASAARPSPRCYGPT